MKPEKFLPKLFLLLLPYLSFAQIHYENGYFINNQDVKTECLIKNMDWEITPTEIQYKLDAASNYQKFTIQDCKEFGVGQSIRYIRRNVGIDQSSDNPRLLSHERNPIYKNEIVFLRLLVGGNANLYVYSVTNKNLFFFSIGESDIKQLVYKRFLMISTKNITPGTYNATSENLDMFENKYFQSQLFKEVNCGNEAPKSFDKLDYTKKELIEHFQKHNACKGGATTDSYSAAITNVKSLYNIKIAAGYNQTSLKMNKVNTNNPDFDFGKKSLISFGAELEYIMPFNKNKWGAFIEPNFSTYKSSVPFKYRELSVNYEEELDIKSRMIEVPIGIRHYFFLTDKSKIFINASYNAVFLKTSALKAEGTDFELDGFKEFHKSYAFGIGYNYDKFYVEARFYTKQDIDSYLYRETEFTKMSFILKYKILH